MVSSIKQQTVAILGAVFIIVTGLLSNSGTVIAADAQIFPTPAIVLAANVETVPTVQTAAAVSKEVVDNPYGLDALWKGGDFVAKGTLVILVIMSMGSWYIMIVKLIEQGKLFKQGKNVQKNFWSASSLADGIAGLMKDSPFKYVAESAQDAAQHHEGKLLEQIDRNTWISMSIDRSVGHVQSRLQEGLAFLATVGSTSPFVGLFGTVWGIYHALTAIGIAGQASIDKVAGPVGEALIMTAIGLAVAVPAVLGYNWLVRRNKAAMEVVRGFAAEVHMVLLGGSNSSTAKRS
jgi:biopolymer transport protein ExbB